jgi:hypothetical protein
VLEKANRDGTTTSGFEVYGHLQESGILLESGELVTDGRVVEIAKEIKRLWEAKDYKGVMDADPYRFNLTDEEHRQLNRTIFTESGCTLFQIMDDSIDLSGYYDE